MLPRCDTVVMNPPFGTKSKGADMDFLHVALATAGHSVSRLMNTALCGNVVHTGVFVTQEQHTAAYTASGMQSVWCCVCRGVGGIAL